MRSKPQLCFVNLAANIYLDNIQKISNFGFNFAHTIASKSPDLVCRITKTSSNERWKPRYRSVAKKSFCGFFCMIVFVCVRAFVCVCVCV